MNRMKTLSITLLLFVSFNLSAFGWPPVGHPTKDNILNGRVMEVFRHGVNQEWEYQTPQEDDFVVVHPKTDRANAPLYVVLHSAGHDVFSCVSCTKTVGNHDIYRSPDDHYALYVDCRKNKGDWWWGGMHPGDKGLIAKNSGADMMPVEKRVMATVAWAIERYSIDPNRVYLSGNSMGGSGTLGIGLRHGDVFAAIKANVPAGVHHASERLFFPLKKVPGGVVLPDPPICIDYSAQNDRWSAGHDQFTKAMNDRRYPFLFYWGPFGHANNSAKIKETNDLIDSFDWLSIRKNEAYPVFTNASTNSQLPWPDDLDSAEPGQVNAFFRWKPLKDTVGDLKMSLFLIPASELETRFEIPSEAHADVTLRRLQDFKLKPGAPFRWTFGSAEGEGKVDSQGLISIAGLKITNRPATLRIRSGKPDPASAKESDIRLQPNGKGWRLDRAQRRDPKRPCVLLIGDSILNGYFRAVTKALAGKAYVDAWVNPHWQSEGTNKLLAAVLDSNGPYDVVHFNMGLHGWTEGRIKPGTFEPLTRAYVEILKAKLPEAKLIWASSTPVTAKDKRLEFDPEINPIIVEHNRMAEKVMAAAKVPVNDFYTLLADKRSLAKGDRFHWTGPAYKLLREMAADSILEAMSHEAK